MTRTPIYSDINQLREYSSIYSRKVFCDIIQYDNYTRLDSLRTRYDSRRKKEKNYLSYIKYTYRKIAQNYRCEYVYKNEIINDILLKEYAHKDTTVFNEFRIQKSIVDLVMFNGHSRAFEIKTEYDSTFRLAKQLSEYTRLFQQCYVVFPENMLRTYSNEVPPNIGLIILKDNNGHITLEKVREATINENIDVTLLMKCLHTEEYKKIVFDFYGYLPDVSCFKMYEECEKLIQKISKDKLQNYFLNLMKHRKNNTYLLKKAPFEIRQICLQLGLSQDQLTILLNRLNKPLTNI